MALINLSFPLPYFVLVAVCTHKSKTTSGTPLCVGFGTTAPLNLRFRDLGIESCNSNM
jgi:hypothetical protein